MTNRLLLTALFLHASSSFAVQQQDAPVTSENGSCYDAAEDTLLLEELQKVRPNLRPQVCIWNLKNSETKIELVKGTIGDGKVAEFKVDLLSKREKPMELGIPGLKCVVENYQLASISAGFENFSIVLDGCHNMETNKFRGVIQIGGTTFHLQTPTTYEEWLERKDRTPFE